MYGPVTIAGGYMKFKISKEEFEKLGDDLKKEYSEKDGSYELKLEDIKIDEAAELKDTLKKVREDLKAAEKTIKGYKDIDPEKYKELISKEEAAAKTLRDKELELARKSKDIETLEARLKADNEKTVSDIQAAHEAKIAELSTKLAETEKNSANMIGSLTKSLESEMLTKRSEAAILTHKGNAHVLLPHVKEQLRLVKEDDAYVVRVNNPKGTEKDPYLKNDKGEFLTESDVVAGMKADQRYADNFEDEKGHSGSGFHRSTSQGGNSNDSPKGVHRIAKGLKAKQ